ncbi:hypothetical protein [Streptomyces luteireticuli]|uniref:hypothetical protein n=1 Tax=Streptomyces luteireticuli TaxID=173858 RepID=UPI0035580761
MKLAIGDVVRDRADMALGTVAGLTSFGSEKCVTVQLPDGGLRLLAPGAMEVVGRHVVQPTAGQGIIALLSLVASLVVVFLSGRAAGDLGGDWLLTILCGLGGHYMVMLAYQWWTRFTSPRRFRI